MPNIKSAKKRVLVTEVKTLQNRMVKSSLKTAVKKADAAIDAGAKAKANAAVTVIDKPAAKGVIHKNNAAHKKSRIVLKYNKLA